VLKCVGARSGQIIAVYILQVMTLGLAGSLLGVALARAVIAAIPLALGASTSLLAIGGALTILRSPDELLSVLATLPFGTPTTRLAWEIKAVGLAVIFVYAFFKFAWSYRLFNYVAILLGAMPFERDKETPEAERHVQRTARLFEAAGRHFNHGQRAIFFALGYLGWFVSPYVLMVTTAAVVFVMWWRQFGSDARRAMDS